MQKDLKILLKPTVLWEFPGKIKSRMTFWTGIEPKMK